MCCGAQEGGGMSMSKRDFVALAAALRQYNHNHWNDYDDVPFTPSQLDHLADFCAGRNPRFDRRRWLAAVRGEL